jgi:uncharacterized Zn finger protein (UPF0148 family)
MRVGGDAVAKATPTHSHCSTCGHVLVDHDPDEGNCTVMGKKETKTGTAEGSAQLSLFSACECRLFSSEGA